MSEKAVATVLIDNERVRVTEWRFAPGAATGWHRHALDYVVLPMTSGELELVGAAAERSRAVLKKGVPYFREAGVEHDVININPFDFAFVEVELRQAGPPKGPCRAGGGEGGPRRREACPGQGQKGQC